MKSSGGGNNSTTSPGTITTEKAGTTSTSSITATATINSTTGAAAAAVSTAAMASLYDKAKASEAEGNKAVIEIKVETTSTAKTVAVEIPKTGFDKAASDTKADLKINTGLGSITFDANAVQAISSAVETGDINIAISKVDVSTLSSEIQQTVGSRPVYDFSVTAGNSNVAQFGNGNAQISIPYTPLAGEDENAIVVYYIDNSGKLNPVNGKYDAASGSVIFTTKHFSAYMVGYNKIHFTDVEDAAWYSDAVSFIAARGIATGTDSSHYSPQAKLTRGQFITMVMRAYGIEADVTGANNFADAGNTYYTNYLAKAKSLGITQGVGNNMFAPNKEITRQEMFTLLYNTLNAIGQLPTDTTKTPLTAFADSGQIASWAKDAMSLFVGTGTIGGSNGKINPTNTTNRAEMAQVLYNLLSK